MTAGKMTRPFVTVNFAVTWDGRVSAGKGGSADFSSKADKRRLLEIRATGDAVLAGLRTITADNMSMGLPAEDLRAARISRGQSEYPLRVLATHSGRVDPELKVFKSSVSPIVIFSTRHMPQKTQETLAEKATLHLAEERVDLEVMMRTLRREYAVRRLVCEGGPTLFRSLLEANLVDEMHVTLCPRIFGGAKAPTLTGTQLEFFSRSKQFAMREMKVVGGECFLRYRLVSR